MKKSFDVAVPKLKKGKYTVVWTTMGTDGHNMNGEYNLLRKLSTRHKKCKKAEKKN
jgi:hypothetical protein